MLKILKIDVSDFEFTYMLHFFDENANLNFEHFESNFDIEQNMKLTKNRNVKKKIHKKSVSVENSNESNIANQAIAKNLTETKKISVFLSETMNSTKAFQIRLKKILFKKFFVDKLKSISKSLFFFDQRAKMLLYHKQYDVFIFQKCLD